MPPWMRAAWLTGSTSSTLSMWRVEIVTTLSKVALGSIPFTTDEPPP
jgi:hypothetical protein